jgi:TonB family protein
MRTFIILAATAIIGTASASEPAAYLTMPVGKGYATNTKGVRYPNAICMRDALYAPSLGVLAAGDPATWPGKDIPEGTSGLYRLFIDHTGRVTQVAIVKTIGHAWLDTGCATAFRQWRFRPGTWKDVVIPVEVHKRWVGIIAK